MKKIVILMLTLALSVATGNAKVQLPVGDMHMSRAHVVINVKVDRNGNTFATLSNFKNTKAADSDFTFNTKAHPGVEVVDMR
jgi:hypothetical protein